MNVYSVTYPLKKDGTTVLKAGGLKIIQHQMNNKSLKDAVVCACS